MDKLKVNYSKSVPLVWDDYAWMQEAILDMIKGITSAYGENFIMSGCEVTITVVNSETNNYSWTAGYIVISGELLKVDAGNIDIDNPNHAIWQVHSSWNVNGTKVDSDGNSVDCYNIRKAKIVSSVLIESITAIESIQKINAIISEFSSTVYAKKNDPTAWTYVLNYQNGWKSSTSGATGYGVRYRIDQFGYLEIQGNLDPSDASDNLVFTLDSTYRPSTPGFHIGIVISHSGIILSFQYNHNGDFTLVGFASQEAGYYINTRFKLS